MRLTSINLANPQPLHIGNRVVTTGIYKNPVEAAYISTLGLVGDHVDDRQHHGGLDQAVYVYSSEDYDWWMEQLGEAMQPGTFGENLTFSSFGTEPVRIGDQFRVGEVLLEVSAPRIPCSTLAARMNDPQFVKKFRQAQRPGFYARVLEAGLVQRDDSVQKTASRTDHPMLSEVFHLWYVETPQAAKLRWILMAPIAKRTREEYARRLRLLEVL